MARAKNNTNLPGHISEHYSATAFRDVLPNQHVRNGFGREDYEYFRPGEAMPKDIKKIITSCNEIYKRNGIVHNIIDLMSDFAAQGINIVHPDRKSQATLRKWFFEKVHGDERSERFLSCFYREANVFIYRQTAKINTKQRVELGRAEGDVDITPAKPAKYRKGEIPWRYIFLDPATIDIVNPELCAFAGKNLYEKRIPENLKDFIKKAKEKGDTEILDSIPQAMLDLILAGKKEIPLDPNKLRVFHYKKDDWELWATPMVYSILPEIQMMEKLHLADLTALDGAISNIRLWNMGSLEHSVLPTREGLAKLAEILQNHMGGGVIDLVWGPDLKVESIASESYKFLGMEKYVPSLNKIYAGLGIPQTLSGSSSGSGGFTNNAISVKTLIERLNYGRDALARFWEEELLIVQKQLGIKPQAQVQFERMTLSDETAEKALWVQLVDRDLISVETLQERFGEDALVERLRIKKEKQDISNKVMPEKAGQFHNPEHQKDLEKTALQNGMSVPSQVGLDYKPAKPEEQLLLKKNYKPTAKPGGPAAKKKIKGKSGQGRPRASKDSAKRKKKRVVPIGATQASANLFIWASNALKKISEILMPAILAKYSKANARQLTDEQFTLAESVKFDILCAVPEMAEITQELVMNTLNTLPAQNEVYNTYSSLLNNLDKPSVEDTRNLMIHAYCVYKGLSDG